MNAMDISMSIVSDFILLQFYHSLFTDPERNKERIKNIIEAIIEDLKIKGQNGQLKYTDLIEGTTIIIATLDFGRMKVRKAPLS